MKNLTFAVILLSVLAVASCTKRDRQAEISSPPAPEQGLDSHTTQNSVDWNGTYSGVIPCADCPGIRTVISLSPDNTFSRRQEYIDREQHFNDRGVIIWDESGQVITLSSDNGSDAKYWVTENRIVMLDRQGNRIEGDLADLYVLMKQHDL